ncbi:hypothetical protein EDB81DRAFT_450376 [Dactylonectria macrodidyma]|uniref:Uncharacterized protein n=1 Tax=Dactylonectria macrodidyma TaxID=307937 RepID=A0A9P9JDN3_9HYPO|nr:hypothetical protein EDB81DRAFT_450376 [Dactylonectria macrodidyma]
MRPSSISALRIAASFCALASLATAFAPNPVHVSDNRALIVDASPIVSNGIASQLPPQDRRRITSDESDSPRLVQKLSSVTFAVSPIEAASINVKAVAHVGINLLLNLASSNGVVGYLIGNETTTLFAKSDSVPDGVIDGSAMSGRRQITGMSVALVIVMIFFAVWM